MSLKTLNRHGVPVGGVRSAVRAASVGVPCLWGLRECPALSFSSLMPRLKAGE